MLHKYPWTVNEQSIDICGSSLTFLNLNILISFLRGGMASVDPLVGIQFLENWQTCCLQLECQGPHSLEAYRIAYICGGIVSTDRRFISGTQV